jgi:hypothetical protein
MDDIIKRIQDLNPLNNSINIGFGIILWKIDPKLNLAPDVLNDPLKLFSQIGESKINIHFEKEFAEDVKIDFYIDGELQLFTGLTKDNSEFEFNVEKKFIDQDITINMNIKGNPVALVSPKGDPTFKVFFGFDKKY